MGKITDLLSKILIVLLKAYQVFISPLLGQRCRFSPSCSQYAKEAVEIHGFFVGIKFAILRLLRCHPFHAGGFDPVPLNKNK